MFPSAHTFTVAPTNVLLHGPRRRLVCLRKTMLAALFFNLAVAVQTSVVHAQSADAHFRRLTPQPASDLLDDIIDIGADSSGRVYVADGKRGRILILDRVLQAIAAVGRKGSGPGEFREIRAVRGTTNGVLVADRVLRRITTYEWKGTEVVLQRSLTLDFEPYDVCPYATGQLLVLGRRQGYRLHVVDITTGKVVMSGARFPANISLSLSDNVIEGGIACAGEGRTGLLTSTYLPGFDLVNLTTLQVVRTDTLRPVRLLTIEDTGNRQSFSSGPQGYHAPERAFYHAGQWIVQARTVARQDHVSGDSVLMFVRSADGRPSGYSLRAGRLFPISLDTAIVAIEDMEFTMKKVGITSTVARKITR